MEKTIGEIKKTNTVVTKVRLTEFKGKQLIDIRDWFKPKNNNDYAPTKKGITLNISKAGEIVTLLEQTEDELSKRSA